MKHLDSREDFNTDEEFANFRSLILRNRKSTMFFRSASAIKNTYGRLEITQKLMRERSIVSIIDFSDVRYRCMSYEFGLALTRKIYEIFAKESPYIIQCDAGKKRTGFVCIVLEMLSGTTYDNIVADYLESYKNNNGIDFSINPEIAKKIEFQKVQKIIRYINDDNDYEKANLKTIACKYLQKHGMSKQEIKMLQAKLY